MLGCGNFGGVGSAPEFFGKGESDEKAFEIMNAAWEIEIRTFDTADAYGGGRSEAAIGRWLRARGEVRDRLVCRPVFPIAHRVMRQNKNNG